MSNSPFTTVTVALGMLLSSCENDQLSVQTHEYSARDFGTMSLDNSKAFVVSNELGGVIIEGSSDTSTFRWFLDKSVTAETQSRANELLAQIVVEYIVLTDTAFISVGSPSSTNLASSSMSLALPHSKPCILRKVRQSISVSYLNSTLVGENVRSITVIGHTGNCILAVSQGDVSVEMALPVWGVCRVAVSDGAISLRVPSSTSAFLSAATGSGKIVFSGIVLSNPITTNQTLIGQLGAGEGIIQLTTARGNISIVGF